MRDKYLFIRILEDQYEIETSYNLGDFKKFCHYSRLSNWQEHKATIKEWLNEVNVYPFTGNDVEYYVIRMTEY